MALEFVPIPTDTAPPDSAGDEPEKDAPNGATSIMHGNGLNFHTGDAAYPA